MDGNGKKGLGNSGLDIVRVSFGAWAIGAYCRGDELAEIEKALQSFLAAGN